LEEPIDPWSRQPEPPFPLDQRAKRNYNYLSHVTGIYLNRVQQKGC
jgi:hypothetical protein